MTSRSTAPSRPRWRRPWRRLRPVASRGPIRRRGGAGSRWTTEPGTIARPPGVMIDTGGTGKGLCADAVAFRLARYTRFVVDCGGDIAVGGVGAQLEPYEIDVQHPLTLRSIGSIKVARGGIATSGLNVRIWRLRRWWLCPPPARPEHGLARLERADRRDRARATARSRRRPSRRWRCCSARHGARQVLAEHGGVIVHDSGEFETVGPVVCEPAVRPVALRA